MLEAAPAAEDGALAAVAAGAALAAEQADPASIAAAAVSVDQIHPVAGALADLPRALLAHASGSVRAPLAMDARPTGVEAVAVVV